nr:programmed cell death protein 5 [Quercus suber]
MADDELDAIRQARLQQLQSQPNGGGAGQSSGNPQEDERKSREAQMRASMLAQILEPAAADRLNRIRLVKASRAEDVENRLISLAQSRQLRGPVSETQLKEILGAISEQAEEREKAMFTVQRRKGGWDEDDLEDLLAD